MRMAGRFIGVVNVLAGQGLMAQHNTEEIEIHELELRWNQTLPTWIFINGVNSRHLVNPITVDTVYDVDLSGIWLLGVDSSNDGNVRFLRTGQLQTIPEPVILPKYIMDIRENL